MAATPGRRSEGDKWSLGFFLGVLPAVALGGMAVWSLFPARRLDAGQITKWASFVLGSVVIPGLASVGLERRWPRFARGLATAVVVIGCPMNMLILVGLLSMNWSR